MWSGGLAEQAVRGKHEVLSCILEPDLRLDLLEGLEPVPALAGEVGLLRALAKSCAHQILHRDCQTIHLLLAASAYLDSQGSD